MTKYSSKPTDNQTIASTLEPFDVSVDQDAETMMDELFSDIDNLLAGGEKPPSRPQSHPEHLSLDSVVVPPIQITPPPEESQLAKRGNDPQTEAAPTATPTPVPARNQRGDKWLFFISLAAFLGICGWLVGEDRLQWPWFLEPASERASNVAPVSQADQEFIAYLQRSLDLVERQEFEGEPPAVPPIPGDSGALPSNGANVPGTAIAEDDSQTSERVTERVYIPVYPPNFGTPPTTPSTPTPKPETAIAPLPPTGAMENNNGESTPPAAVPIAHTLVGLLELGDNSAALFKIEDTTQRIRLGEMIGSSGWTLVSVSAQQAIIRRNGEVTSIMVGQAL